MIREVTTAAGTLPLRDVRVIAASCAGEVPAVYARLALAARVGRGVRLTADEVHQVVMRDAAIGCVLIDVIERGDTCTECEAPFGCELGACVLRERP